jgi:large subunit ribosomal protein L27
MAHTKSLGTSKNLRESESKRLGVKKQNGEPINAGQIIIRQRGTRYIPGKNVRRGADDTLYAATKGKVKFQSSKKTKFDGNIRYIKIVSVVTA